MVGWLDGLNGYLARLMLTTEEDISSEAFWTCSSLYKQLKEGRERGGAAREARASNMVGSCVLLKRLKV